MLFLEDFKYWNYLLALKSVDPCPVPVQGGSPTDRPLTSLAPPGAHKAHSALHASTNVSGLSRARRTPGAAVQTWRVEACLRLKKHSLIAVWFAPLNKDVAFFTKSSPVLLRILFSSVIFKSFVLFVKMFRCCLNSCFVTSVRTSFNCPSMFFLRTRSVVVRTGATGWACKVTS